MIIYRDSREKKNYWVFAGKRCQKAALKTADYTLKGYEDKIAIERKASVSEWATCCGSDWARFKKEIIRMQDIECAHIICEFDVVEMMGFPWKSDLPKSVKARIKVRGPFLTKRTEEIESMGIPVHFVGSRENAIDLVTDIFNNFLEEQPK